MNSSLAMMVSSFFTVFLLGLQSRNVQRSDYAAAILTSFFITVANFTSIHYVANGTPIDFVGGALGGCLGIACSIWVSDCVIKKKKSPAPDLAPSRGITSPEKYVAVSNLVNPVQGWMN
jgi:hypothetical protein